MFRPLAQSQRLARSLTTSLRASARVAFSTSARRAAPGSPLSITSTEPVFFDRVKLVKTPTVVDAPLEEYERIPAFRVLDGEGTVLPGVEGEWLKALEGIPDDKLVKLYKCMMLLPALVRKRRGERGRKELTERGLGHHPRVLAATGQDLVLHDELWRGGRCVV